VKPSVTTTPVRKTTGAEDLLLEDPCQVVLYNDDFNAAEFVVACLVQVFGHPAGLAAKIMTEAHQNGRAIAQVEGRSEAVLHRQQLQSFGLTADVEPL
jgi:ATP-dependent Clp protease adaptor protein ClpS